MNEDTIKTFVTLLDNFIVEKNTYSQKITEYDNKLIYEYIAIQDQYQKYALNVMESLIPEYLEIDKFYKEKNKEESYRHNLLSIFRPSETMHSNLIAYLLNPLESHGQDKLFLIEFLKYLKISKPESGNWRVTAETGRIDIMLKRNSPESVIIIENKSNNAGDQPNQIYRYWHQEMYLPNDEEKYRYTLDNKEHYRIIYLSPHEYKIPNEDTITKPSSKWFNETYPDLPEKLKEDDVEIWHFHKQITEWLEICLSSNDLSKNNHRLREYIKQYIEYWENK
jgi:hypothetical protein